MTKHASEGKPGRLYQKSKIGVQKVLQKCLKKEIGYQITHKPALLRPHSYISLYMYRMFHISTFKVISNSWFYQLTLAANVSRTLLGPTCAQSKIGSIIVRLNRDLKGRDLEKGKGQIALEKAEVSEGLNLESLSSVVSLNSSVEST